MTHDPDGNISVQPIPEVSEATFKQALFGGWQPIETAPKDWDLVVYCPPDLHDGNVFGKNGVTTAEYNRDGWYASNSDLWPLFPTHWQHLPDPPSI